MIRRTDDRRARAALRSVRVPGQAGAELRALRVVRAAYADRPPPLARRDPRLRLGLAAAVALLLVAVALTPPGAAVAGWVRDVVSRPQPGRAHAQPSLAGLPGRGRLLVQSAAGPWIVHPDGHRRLLGRYSGATWSPHGLFVAAWRADELTALEPTGRVRWVLPTGRPVAAARWSPDGFRIALRRTDGTLMVLAGDGTGLRVRARDASGPFAWRPGPGHLLAYARRGGVSIIDADAGRTLARVARLGRTARLAWSADGSLLAAADRGRLVVVDARGKVLRRVAIRAASIAFAPRGHRLAIVRHDDRRDRSEALLLSPQSRRPRVLLAGAGTFANLAWSPDARWLLASWREADQWVFIPLGSGRRLVAVARIAAQFGHRGAFPALAGWCCPSGTGLPAP
jgi:hypothetical protein